MKTNVILFILTFISLFMLSQHDVQSYLQKVEVNVGFVENKGQFHDQYYRAVPHVKYLLHCGNGMNVQLRTNGFSYDTYRIEEKEKEADTYEGKTKIRKGFKEKESEKEYIYYFHRVDVDLLGANVSPQIIAEGVSSDYLNFYNAVTPESGATFVRKYRKVVYKEIYPKIDLEFELDKNNGLKYNFIVYPGGDVSNIRMCYRGAEETKLDDENILLKVSHGSFSENIPASWLEESKQSVDVKYKVLGENIYGFDIAKYDVSKTLVIDPIVLQWGTYYGSTSVDNCNEILYDGIAYVYAVGYSSSASSIATSGVHQATYGGNGDALLVKFSTSGIRQWCTYYGGSGSDHFTGIYFFDNASIYVIGDTESTSAIATSGAHQTVYGGNTYDAFVVKFNSSGIRQWGTYYGGSNNDYSNGISCDNNGNIYFTGYTKSTSAIATSGTHQPSLAGNVDAFVVKFNALGVRQWGTYYGGSGYDYAWGISCADNGNVYITGNTTSAAGIATSGTHQTNFAGYRDAFVAKFNANGVCQWSTYFGGDGTDYGYDIFYDGINKIYVTGYTTSISGIATQGAHQVTNAGNDAFVAKFNDYGMRLWGTYYGGSEDDHGNKIFCDFGGNIYLIGSTRSTTNIATSGTHQTTLGGYSDAYIVKFNSSGVRQWGTYYGGNYYDYGYGIFSDVHGNVYITGETSSDYGISTYGAFQSNFGGNIDVFIAKFIRHSITISPTSSDSQTVCINTAIDTITYYVENAANVTVTGLPSGVNYIFSYNVIIISGTPTSSGMFNYTITTNYGISVSGSINVIDVPTVVASSTGPYCVGQTIELSSSGGTSYSWSGPNSFTSNVQNPSIVDATTAMTGIYTVTVTNNEGCTATVNVEVIVNSQPQALFSYNNLGQNQVAFINSSLYASSYYWNFGDGNVSNTQNPIHIYADSGTYIVVLIVSNNCGSDTLSQLINVSSIAYTEIEFNINIFPNPNYGKFDLHIISDYIGKVNIVVFDVIGRKVMVNEVEKNIKEVYVPINMRNMSNGVYRMIVQIDDKLFYTNVVINKN